MMKTHLGKDRKTGKPIFVKDSVRQSGFYILGTQGQGKSLFISNLAYQDIEKHYAVIVFDPHGDLITHLLAQMPEALLEKTFLLDMTDTDFPFGLNLFDFSEITAEIDRAMAVDRIMHIFERLWPEIKGVLLEKLLRYITLTFSEAPGHTLADIPRLLWDDAFRATIVARLTNLEVQAYWLNEYNRMTIAERRRETQALSNRLAAFLAIPMVRNIVCQQKTTIDIRSAIQEHEILLINLPMKRMKDAATLIGTILLAQMHAVTFAFGELDWNQRPGYSLFVDEFQNFATGDFAELFQEGRKFGARIAVAHQSRRDLVATNRSATLTASIIAAFQLTPEDASELAPLFLDSSIKLRPEYIYPDVLRRLRLHEALEIQEFFRAYILPLQKQEGADNAEILELLQDLLYQSVKTQTINEDFFQTCTQQMFPILGLTFDGPERKRKDMRSKLQQQGQVIEKLAAFLADDAAFEEYLTAYYSFYSGFTYRQTAEWYYQPFVPEDFVLSDRRFWGYVFGKEPHPYEHLLGSFHKDIQEVIASLQKQATANDALQQRDTPEKLLAEEKARIGVERNRVVTTLWEAIAKLHKLKSTSAAYPSIRQFHEQAHQVCLAEAREQRSDPDPLFVQPIGSTQKRGVVDHTTRVEELVIRPPSFEDATSRDQVLAWLPALSGNPYSGERMQQQRQVEYDIQTAWSEITRRYADFQKITHLLADETAVLKNYYAQIGKEMGSAYQETWKELNDEYIDRKVWEALAKETRRNAYLSREMNTVEKLIQLRKNELQKKIARLIEEYQAYKATVPTLEKRIAEEIASIEKEQTLYRDYMRRIIEILIQEPGPLGEKRTLRESDVKETLLNLPKRQAFVRIGGDIAQEPYKCIMQTADARQAVKQGELKQRLHRTRERTRNAYCHSRTEVEQILHEKVMGTSKEVSGHGDDEPPQSWYEEEDRESDHEGERQRQ